MLRLVWRSGVLTHSEGGISTIQDDGDLQEANLEPLLPEDPHDEAEDGAPEPEGTPPLALWPKRLIETQAGGLDVSQKECRSYRCAKHDRCPGCSPENSRR